MVRDFESGGVAVKHQIVEALQTTYSVEELCRFLQISRSGYYKYVQRQQQPKQDEEQRVTDVTYIQTMEGWLYLSPIMDLFNNEIISYCIQDRNDNA